MARHGRTSCLQPPPWICSNGQNFLRFPEKILRFSRQFAFNYFIKTPKESSPLIFTTSGETINAEEGKLVIFPASLIHEVPKNKCDDRIVLSGNIFPNVWENI